MDFEGRELIIERKNRNRFVPVEGEVTFPNGEMLFLINIDPSDIPYNQDGYIVFIEDQQLIGPIDFEIEVTHLNGVVEKHVMTIGDKPAENLDQLSDFLSAWLEGALRTVDLPHAESGGFTNLFSDLILDNIQSGAITIDEQGLDDVDEFSVRSYAYRSNEEELRSAILSLIGSKRNVRIDYIVNECRSLGYSSTEVHNQISNLISAGDIVKNRNTGAIQRV